MTRRSRPGRSDDAVVRPAVGDGPTPPPSLNRGGRAEIAWSPEIDRVFPAAMTITREEYRRGRTIADKELVRWHRLRVLSDAGVPVAEILRRWEPLGEAS